MQDAEQNGGDEPGTEPSEENLRQENHPHDGDDSEAEADSDELDVLRFHYYTTPFNFFQAER